MQFNWYPRATTQTPFHFSIQYWKIHNIGLTVNYIKLQQMYTRYLEFHAKTTTENM